MGSVLVLILRTGGESSSFYAVRAAPCGSAGLIVRCLIRLFPLCWIGGSAVRCLFRLFPLCWIGGSTVRCLFRLFPLGASACWLGGLGPGPHSVCAASLSQLMCSRGLGWLYALASMCCASMLLERLPHSDYARGDLALVRKASWVLERLPRSHYACGGPASMREASMVLERFPHSREV